MTDSQGRYDRLATLLEHSEVRDENHRHPPDPGSNETGIDPATPRHSPLSAASRSRVAYHPVVDGCGGTHFPASLLNLSGDAHVLDLVPSSHLATFRVAIEVVTDGRVTRVVSSQSVLNQAKAVIEEAGWNNVEFRLGETSHLPIPDESIDVILAGHPAETTTWGPDSLEELFRTLRPAGRALLFDRGGSDERVGWLSEDLEAIGFRDIARWGYNDGRVASEQATADEGEVGTSTIVEAVKPRDATIENPLRFL